MQYSTEAIRRKAERAMLAEYKGKFAEHLPKIRSLLVEGKTNRDVALAVQQDDPNANYYELMQSVAYIAKRDQRNAWLKS